MIGGFVLFIASLAVVPALNAMLNAVLLRRPELPAQPPSVAILIPARDEEKAIGPCVEAALASTHADIEVIVLDDGSTDRTRAVVEAIAARDARVRIEAAPPLPEGWKGKVHACHILSTLTERPCLLFVDADVRLAPEAAARLAPGTGENLVSGIPRQQVEGFMEAAIVPMINSVLYFYLPLFIAQKNAAIPGLAAACGQLLMVRADAYRAAGGHAAIASRMHDALHLARNFRKATLGSTLVDATALATCRMYDTADAVWSGFSKNATEGMARPLALPVWSVLLIGGQLLPILSLALALTTPLFTRGETVLLALSCLMLVVARAALAVKCRERWSAVLVHPVGVVLTLAIQYQAFWRYLRGGRAEWRGRSYAVDL